jgi:HEAT repeat protein
VQKKEEVTMTNREVLRLLRAVFQREVRERTQQLATEQARPLPAGSPWGQTTGIASSTFAAFAGGVRFRGSTPQPFEVRAASPDGLVHVLLGEVEAPPRLVAYVHTPQPELAGRTVKITVEGDARRLQAEVVLEPAGSEGCRAVHDFGSFAEQASALGRGCSVQAELTDDTTGPNNPRSPSPPGVTFSGSNGRKGGPAEEALLELRRLLEVFLDAKDPFAWRAWQQLAGPARSLRNALQRAVDDAPHTDPLPLLAECWDWLVVEGAAERVGLYCRMTPEHEEVDAQRLHRNACALLATARVAALARRIATHPESCKLMVLALQDASSLFGGPPAVDWDLSCRLVENQFHLDATRESYNGHNCRSWAWDLDNSPKQLVADACAALAALGWQVAEVHLWTNYWLGNLSGKTVRITTAAWDDSQRIVFRTELELTPLAHCEARLIEHPDQALRPLGASLLKAVTAAWEPTGKAVCWQLTSRDQRLLPERPLDGDSLSGAAAVGFRLLDTGRAYDSSCLVVARVGEGGRDLESVGHENDKLREARAWGFTRAVLAPNHTLTATELQQLHEDGLRTIPLQTLDEAVEFASTLAEQLGKYLQTVIDLPDQERPAYLGQRLLTKLFIPQDVLSATDRGEGDPRPSRRRVASLLEEEWGGPVREDRRRRVAWRREYKTHQHAVLLGRPGEGKTLLGRMTMHWIAAAAKAELDAQQKGTGHVALPICLRLVDVARCGSLEGALREQTLAPEVADLLCHALRMGRCWLFLDGLDEVDPADHPALKKALEVLRGSLCQVLVTSRPYGYDRTLLPFPTVAEYELAPPSPRAQREFISRWFQGQWQGEPHAQQVRELVQGNPRFEGLTQCPLLLTLTCVVAERHPLPADARRVDLYRRILRDMVRRVWGPNPLPANHPKVIELISLLQRLAWSLFDPDNPGRTFFRDSEVYSRLARAVDSLRLAGRDTTQVLEELQQTGLLVCPSSGQLMFLHRTFLEFLAAEEVAQQPGKGAILAAVTPFLWRRKGQEEYHWQPAAAEMLRFLGGCLDDPNPLLRCLLETDRNQPDHFRTMALLAGRCLAEANPARVDEALRQRITDTAFELFRATPAGLHLADVAPSLAHPEGLARLTRELATGEPPLRQRAARALGQLGSVRGLDALGNALDPGHNPRAEVRGSAAVALGQLGSEWAAEALVRALDDPEERVVQVAARALGQVGGGRAVDGLLKALARLQGGGPARPEVVAALGRAGDPRAVSALLALLGDPGVGESAARALVQIGEPAAVAPLLARLRGAAADIADQHECHNTAWALGLLGGEQAIAPLLGVLRESRTKIVRDCVVRALGWIGSGALEPRLELLFTEVTELRWWAVKALGLLGSERAVGLLVAALRDENSEVRWRAARALGQVRSRQAVKPLLAVLADDDERMRLHAVRSLGQIGDAQALAPLIRALEQDRKLTVRLEAVAALGRLGLEQAVPSLCQALENKNPHLRQHAVQALGQLGCQRAVPPLLRLLNDRRVITVREAAVEALGRIGGPEAVTALVQALHDEDLGPHAALALLELRGAAAVSSLEQAVLASNVKVRELAADVLGEIGNDESVRSFLPAVRQSPRGRVRQRLLEALRRISWRTGRRICLPAG